jgi:hypothetical protein
VAGWKGGFFGLETRCALRVTGAHQGEVKWWVGGGWGERKLRGWEEARRRGCGRRSRGAGRGLAVADEPVVAGPFEFDVGRLFHASAPTTSTPDQRRPACGRIVGRCGWGTGKAQGWCRRLGRPGVRVR